MVSRLGAFFSELKRRKVYHVAAVYVVVGLAVSQGAEWAFSLIELPVVAAQVVALLVLLGFPIALVLAWAYEVRPEEPRDPKRQPIPLSEHLVSPHRKSIVVLPFDNLSPDPADAYFSDGLTEEIITDLSCCNMLRVISRNSAMAVKGTGKDTRTLASELSVQYVLTGSVRKAGENLRITAQLIDAGNDEHIWTGKYDGTLQDVFEIQESVSKEIVDALQLKLGVREAELLTERPIEDVHAFDCYLRARPEIWSFTEAGLKRGLQLLRNGLEIAGENELLYAAMGNAYVQYVNAGIDPHGKYLQQADDCARKVFDLNPDSPEGHFLRGFVRIMEGQLQEAVNHLKKSAALNPNDPDSLHWLALLYSLAGREPLGRPLSQRVLLLDPLTAVHHAMPGWFDFLEGDAKAALAPFEKMYRMEPESPVSQFLYAIILAHNEQSQDALVVLDVLAANSPGTVFGGWATFMASALQGRRDQALQAVTPTLASNAKWDAQVSWVMADTYALLDERESALEYLRNAADRGFINYPFLANHDRLLENLRADPQFQSFLGTVKNSWEAFEA